MKIIKYLYILGLLSLVNCNLAEVNEDRNRPKEVPTSTLMLSAQKQIMDNIRGESYSLRGTTLFSQYFSQIMYTTQSRYDIPLEYSDDYWDKAYLVLNNLNFIIDYNTNSSSVVAASFSGRNTSQIAIARILMAFTFQALTDAFGNIPYQSYGGNDPDFQALQQNPSNFTPVYASQEKIYTDILEELKSAADTLLKYKDENTFGSSDVIYKGNNEKWAKFANSLRLRVATRIRHKLPEISDRHFADALAKGVFTSNSDNAIFKYCSQAPNEAPLFRATITANRKDFAVSNVVIETLKGERGNIGVSDPRLPIFARKVKGEYRPTPYGLPESVTSKFLADSVSLPGELINAADFGEVLQEYAEVEFLISEYNNWDASAYVKGVRASLERWGVSENEILIYLSSLPSVNKEQVLNQKYVALYTQGQEAWAEIRRTGYPKFLIQPGDIIWNYMGEDILFQPLYGDGIPRRFRYPSKEQSVNRTNYQKALFVQGADAITTKLWWNN